MDSRLLRLVIRSEEISEHNLPLDTPIRIHKYNLDELENNSDSDENSGSESQSEENDEDDSTSLENNLVQIKKRVVESINPQWPFSKSHIIAKYYLCLTLNLINPILIPRISISISRRQ